MKISGFTITRNAGRYGYPLLESIRSILPLVDEFIVNVGDSDDDTLQLIRSIDSPKIKIIENVWDFAQGKEVLSYQTNLALAACTGDWAFYLQNDEVVHEADLPRLRRMMKTALHQDVDALRFKWFHFYGSYFRYRIDAGWYQKQDRIIRNNGTTESTGDAWGFVRRDGQPLRRKSSGAFIYHYGWVQHPGVMKERRLNADRIGFIQLDETQKRLPFEFGELSRYPPYFGSHPRVMQERVQEHHISQKDLHFIQQRYWWHPARWLRTRYKTGKRHKQALALQSFVAV